MSEKCPKRIWVLPSVAADLGARPRYFLSADYVRGDLYEAAIKRNEELAGEVTRLRQFDPRDENGRLKPAEPFIQE